MKSIRSIKTGLMLLGLFCAASGANVAHAQLSYLIDINTASIVNHPAGPFSLDLQSNWGDSITGDTVTLSNFTFTGGSYAGPSTLLGAVTGNLASTLVFNPNSSNPFNEFFQQFDASVSHIQFNLNLTTSSAILTPASFSVAILDSNLFNIPTTGVGNSLLLFNINGNSTNYQTATSIDATSGVTMGVTAIPEPSTYALLAGVTALAAVILRRRSTCQEA